MTRTISGNPMLGTHTGPIDLSRPHFVGIGTPMLAGLAQICAVRGAFVTGTTGTTGVDFGQVTVLREAGCAVTVGPDPAAAGSASCVVFTPADADTPELAAAGKHGVPVVHWAQVVNVLAGRLIVVAGTHGTTSTAGMLAGGLRELGQDPSFLIGTDIDVPGSGAHAGVQFFVTEADESDHALLQLTASAAVVTAIVGDHPENYDNLTSRMSAYVSFAARMRPQAVLAVNGDDPGCRHLAARLRTLRPDLRIRTYGYTVGTDVQIVGVSRRSWNSQVEVDIRGAGCAVMTLRTPSLAHVSHAAAALTLLTGLGFGHLAAATAVSGADTALAGELPSHQRRESHHQGESPRRTSP
ncbi:hypothetical protein Aca07nite_88270 [Actinoplanes capillaceus]|uniref:UDP-N-acetylmuramate--L-alanine ligase n=1 Tax=Actinoplanes campanulatus TaxID=113559 RepID=A0ABQ3WZ43_9ACTN|nr:Mur ligase family protein [Actinoplanes capillaceus]GID51552.1 hypothetical protein Aca07nite_88270 [Actinoplanes capillaceus]